MIRKSKVFIARIKITYWPDDGEVDALGVSDALKDLNEQYDEHSTEKSEILNVFEIKGSERSWEQDINDHD